MATVPAPIPPPDRSVSPQPHGNGRQQPTLPQTYLYLALFAFALVGMELVIGAVEPVFGLHSDSLAAQIVHWLLTIVVWVSGVIGLVAWALRRTNFRLRGAATPQVGLTRWLALASLMLLTLTGQWFLRGGVFPPVGEHNALTERFGDAGTLAWLVQVLYYFAETAVIVLIIGFGQKAGERWFRLTWVPWGGILLALTWGLVHSLTQNYATAVYGIALSVVMGAIHLLTGKNLLITYPLLLVVFIL